MLSSGDDTYSLVIDFELASRAKPPAVIRELSTFTNSRTGNSARSAIERSPIRVLGASLSP